MVVQVSRAGAKNCFRVTELIQPALAKASIRVHIVLFKIKIMFNEGRPKKCVIPDTIAAYPRVDQRQGEEKKQEEQALGLARARPGRRI
jgi:hypothetical protein